MRTVQLLSKAAAALMTVLQVAAGAMLIGSVGINFANIIGRYFLSVSLSWAEEVMLFLMIGCVFLAAGPVGWMGRNIRMDVVVSALPERLRAAFEIFADLVTIATCIALAIFAWPVMTMLTELDQRSDSANIPLVIPQAAVPLGLLLMALLIGMRLVVQGVRHDDVISSRGASTEPEH
ncbi:MAG TPA: TRAP transporter small permease [Xanthobacteraceae bacterium]|jgi:C4-dicarboxylate transporter DctQ subunit|nr:TRAP transporter small permease [Xanthobacteraceae bacterium]